MSFLENLLCPTVKAKVSNDTCSVCSNLDAIKAATRPIKCKHTRWTG